ncbi:PREDICTED: GDH/6PGL endoplasmic bifunctional protein isoform X2 [Gavialis gangeticus]|uniref:GDH/6PGL endoplasmic bifunctional protein isoform X2 n=1 Tax=Gavialis gangeticus TaxID=94835 RepID=UPI00092FD1D9|nr:PREDICTED: GDH/6PGL endoplasmic bifunctional protein isoform X2 [Gavialis gangeticus]
MLRAVLCVIFLLRALPASAKESRGHISVVLLGATGDLAKKYLWQGLFQLYRDEVSNGHSFTFHGAALTAPEPGQKMMFEVLKNLACPPDEHPTRCAVLKDQFLKLSQYYQLRTAENYTVLNREIETLLEQEGLEEAGRIFYFSVPPFAYAEIAGHINSSCRPRPGAWLRVVLEKPFGHDLESAQQLAAELRNFFKEEEMYRVDHYLGKQAVAHILPFRDQNRQFLDPIWNRHHVERVEIVLKETVDAKGVLIHVDSLRWEGVPFILTSGKALDERVGYIRVLFKNRAYCTQSEALRDAEHSQCKAKQIIFYIGHGELNSPAVLVSRNLFRPVMPEGSWREVTDRPQMHLFGQPLSDYYVYSPMKERDAYAMLISSIYHARKDFFITTENLLASWEFWTPLLDSISHQAPRLYPGGRENQHLLDFEMLGQELSFTLAEPVELLHTSKQTPDDYQTIQTKFRNSSLVSAWPEELVSQLASDLEAVAARAVARSGEFHLAVSGGSSPVVLFQRLAKHHYGFPWKRTHLWLVDERCVPLTDPESNFCSLHNHLLQHVRLPYFNLHPMPVHLNWRLCVEEDQGPELYAEEIAALVTNASFDLILLGVGADGHTASLFPRSSSGLGGDQAVVLTESPVKPHQRMSLSLPFINKARQVFILVLGRGKHEIITLLSRVGNEPKKWPISGVRPSSGQLVWYMDYEALLG